MKKWSTVLPAFCLLAITACNKYKAEEFTVPPPVAVTNQQTIDTFQALKSYINHTANPDFKLGVALSVNDYNSRNIIYRMANSNFEELVVGYEMKHGAIVQSNGTLALDKVSQFINTAKQASIPIYGHTLAWHANQNATYLNNLISPLLATIPAFNNDLNTAAPKAGNLTGWNLAAPGSGITIETGAGMVANTNAIKLVSGANASSAVSLKLVSPSITINPARPYEVLCYIKSSAPGQGRIAFEGLTNNTPTQDWTGTGTKTESFTTDISWKAIKATVSDFTGTSIKLHFDLGYKPNVTYYIDVNSLFVYDPQGAAPVTNLVKEGDFETGSGWGGWGGSSTRGITATGLGYGGGKAFYVTNPTAGANYWDVQTIYNLDAPLTNGDTYLLSFWVKGTAAGIIRPELQSANYSSDGYGQVPVTTSWTQINLSVRANAADRNRLVFSYGEFAGTVYIDNVVLKNSRSTGGTLTVQKSAAEKDTLLTRAMTTWISGMMNTCKSYVKAWDVVNEPMDDARPAELKTATGRTTIAADEFFWQDYMGKDYAVKAFQMAAQYGNPDDKLFINDYNLEYDLNKCRGLIAYASYIQGKGGRIDGIGTQMHISINSDTSKIATMFGLLATTGKLIKISELDIGLGGATAATATPAQYMAQANMYKYVIDKYFQLVPKAQRYGITIWSPLDSPAGASWRPNDPIGLWNSSYIRKTAYAYVAEALRANAGK